MQAFEVERPTAVERRKLKPVSWIIAALLCAAFLAGLIGFCSRNGGNSASKVGSCKPGDVDSYAGIIHKDKGGWCLNNVCGDYRFDLNSGWLFGGEEKVGQFSCQRLQSDMLNLTSDAVWKLRDYFHILSSEIMTEIQKEENAGALFVVPAQLNGAEYPSATRVVHHVADYKEDIRGGPRGQLAAHPAVAQFLLDNAQSVERPKGINAADQIVDLSGFEVVNGYMKIQKTDKVKETLQDLKRRLNSLRLLVMEHVSTQGLVPKLSGFAKTSHRVGLVYASTIPVDSYVNGRTGESDPTDHEYQTQVAELMLVAQYYGALKYAAETTQKIVELTPRHRPRKVFLMPLGGGSFQNPWEIIGRSMAKAIQMLDHELLVTLEISALAFNQKPSEKEKLQSILEKLHSKVQIDERCIESGGSNHMVGAFRPTCQSDGSFAPQQCWGSTGFCWCSDKVGHEFRETRGREEVEGVFSFPCFSQEFVKLFNAEIENFYASKIPARRPNSMNNYGVIVNEIGMRPMITQFQQEYIWPIAKALFPDEASQFDSHHSFIVRYTATEDLGLDMHTDDSDITFNVCLGFEFTGATLTFCGYMGAADHRKASHVYHHEVGRAMLHLGSRRHGADNIESGTRMNLIVWSHNKAWRRAHPSRLRREYYAKEDGPPDEVCLSYTHDRDYLAYKKAPKGRAGGRNRPWCPPEGKEYENFPDSDTSM